MTAGWLSLSARGVFGQTLRRGQLFEITDFKEESLETESGREKTLRLSFRVLQSGTWSGISSRVTLYDGKKRQIQNGIRESLFDRDQRQSTAIKTKDYVRGRGNGSVYKLDDFKGLRTYTFWFVLNRRYSYAVATVGNEAEKVFAIIPSSANVKEFIPPE